MAHPEYTLWMSLALDNMLAPEQERALQAHLATCPACQAMWQQFTRLDRQLRAAPSMAPAPGFSARVDARLRARRARRYGALGGLLLLAGTTTLWLALVLTAILGTTWWLAHRPLFLIRLVQIATAFFSTLEALENALRLMWEVLTAPPMQPIVLGYASVMLILGLLWIRIVVWQRRAAPSGITST